MPRSLSPCASENANSALSYCVQKHFHDAYNKSVAQNIVRNLFIISHHLSASSPSYCWICVCVCVCYLRGIYSWTSENFISGQPAIDHGETMLIEWGGERRWDIWTVWNYSSAILKLQWKWVVGYFWERGEGQLSNWISSGWFVPLQFNFMNLNQIVVKEKRKGRKLRNMKRQAINYKMNNK